MAYLQAIDLGGCVRKGEKGSLTVYADKITRTETDSTSGEECRTIFATSHRPANGRTPPGRFPDTTLTLGSR
jgi:hypothetical protein